mgnify:CR=1 FL=1
MAGFLPEEGPKVDMDQLYSAWKQTAELEKRVYLFEHTLESLQAGLMRKALVDTRVWVNGKPPTSIYLEKVVSVVGFTEEDESNLREVVETLAELKRKYQEAKGNLDILHEQIRIWQTMSANSRKVLN